MGLQGLLVSSFAVVLGGAVRADQAWDTREARTLREQLLPSWRSRSDHAHIDSHTPDGDADLFEVLGKLGDVPGATTVRDRLAAEAANKAEAFERRLAAARGLEAMGLGSLARRVLDVARAEETFGSLEIVRGKIGTLAVQRGVTICR